MLLAGALLGGRCLPCGDLFAKATARSCCNKSGACNKLPTSKSEKRAPCPLLQNVLALQHAGSDVPSIHLADAVAPALLPELAEAPAFVASVRISATVPHYSPPPLYVLHERFLI